jgi:hypothetical protein
VFEVGGVGDPAAVTGLQGDHPELAPALTVGVLKEGRRCRASWASSWRAGIGPKAQQPPQSFSICSGMKPIGAFHVKIDQDYLKRLLEACQASEKPTFDIEELKAAGFNRDDPRFGFHMMILADQGLIEQDDGSPGLGLEKSADGSYHRWSVLPLRLTASGHQFIEALSNKEVWATIKHSFKDVASIKTLSDVALKLLEGYAQKKVEQLLS